MQLVQHFGDENWALIASKVKGRSTRQCRERYKNYLSPSINNSPWTQEEEELLYEKYSIYGPKWKLIADFFKNRTDINIKNHWLKLERQKKKGCKDIETSKNSCSNSIRNLDHLSSPELEETNEIPTDIPNDIPITTFIQSTENQNQVYSNQFLQDITLQNQNYQNYIIGQTNLQNKAMIENSSLSCSTPITTIRHIEDKKLINTQFKYAGDYWCSFAEPLLQAFEFDSFQELKPDTIKLLQKVGIT